MLRSFLFSFVVFFLPILVFAKSMTALEVLYSINGVFKNIITLLIGLALVIFLWGIVLYVINDSEAAKAQSIKYITNGLISLFVMTTVWGLVRILDVFVFGNESIFRLPLQ